MEVTDQSEALSANTAELLEEESAQWPTYVHSLHNNESALSATFLCTAFTNGTCFNLDKWSGRDGTTAPN